jgi:Ran GTPase-activating protein (RanGAP) involved in mRNA processing and transport
VDIEKFLDNVKSTGKLEISLVVLNKDDLMQKLNESTIGIHTVEIQSTCKLKQVLVNYSLPPCLEVLRISNNTLDEEDIFALIRSLRNMKGLHELDLCCTKFTETSFNCFITVLIKCSDLRRLCLIDNGLTKQDVNCLITALESLKNLKNLNLSKNDVTETQANDILQKYGEGKSIVSLDLSQTYYKEMKLLFGFVNWTYSKN